MFDLRDLQSSFILKLHKMINYPDIKAQMCFFVSFVFQNVNNPFSGFDYSWAGFLLGVFGVLGV